jgi:AAA+ superfamily predicted ATPase
MGTGELGCRADIAETYLRAIFKRAAKWDAVLLLDEADLFLTKRTASHMERNAFVTLFLRLLEYYQGIMFLTTNRVKEIDRAFDSRIHLSLRFQSPDAKTRAAIWRNFLVSQPDCHSWGTETFERLGQDLEAHGREIKNLIRTALAIADYNNEPLSEDLLRMIYRIKNENKHDDEAKEAKADNGIPGA